MKKIGSVLVLLFLVCTIACSQTIPKALQGSWGANGSQAIRINADGSGEWGEGNLSQSATFRVNGNTLRVQAINMEGQMQWRVDKDTLFLTNPTGFLGELLIAVMKNGGVDRLTRMGTSPTPENNSTSGNSNVSAKSITITGLPFKSGTVSDIGIYDVNTETFFCLAEAEENISNNSVTFTLIDEDGNPFTKSGSYSISLGIENDDIYFYTNGKTLSELGINKISDSLEVFTKLPKYNISSAKSTIPFSQFAKPQYGSR